MIVAGSMIGSGIFIVAGEMAREVGSTGWLLLAWVIAGVLTLAAALSYGELAAMMPRAGGQYVYLREAYSPLWGFLYGWTLFLVIQTGTIAASSVGFSRYLGVLWPQIAENNYIIRPIHILPTYAISLSTAQLVALIVISFLTWANIKGLKYGKGVQNVFTSMKIGSLLGVIGIGVLIGWKASVVKANFGQAWTPQGVTLAAPGLSPADDLRNGGRALHRANRGSVCRGCLEQHHLHRRRSSESHSKCASLSCAGNPDRNRSLHLRQFRIRRGVAVQRNTACALGSSGSDDVAGHLSLRRSHADRGRHHDCGVWLHECLDLVGRSRLLRHVAGWSLLQDAHRF